MMFVVERERPKAVDWWKLTRRKCNRIRRDPIHLLTVRVVVGKDVFGLVEPVLVHVGFRNRSADDVTEGTIQMLMQFNLWCIH